MKNLTAILFLTFILPSFSSRFCAQEIPERGFKAGLGIGIVEIDMTSCLLSVFEFEYQTAYLNNRLRFAPKVLLGDATSVLTADSRDLYCRVSFMDVDVFYDVIALRSLSLFLGGGLFLNYSRGLWGDISTENNTESSEFFYDLNYGGGFGAGLRLAPPEKRLSWEVKLNGNVGNDDFVMLWYSFGTVLKLNKMR